MVGEDLHRSDDQPSSHEEDDLLVVAFAGVQAFITQSRRTGDLHGGSRIITELVRVAAKAVAGSGGATLVFPSESVLSDRGSSLPNRIVAFLPAGTGAAVAERAVTQVHETWQGWLRRANGSAVDVRESQGFPSVQWIRLPPGGDYRQRWKLAQQALSARRRIREFDEAEWFQRRLCSLTPRWPAVQRPAGVPQAEDDTLAAASWVKRRWRLLEPDQDEQTRFASTSSIASAPYRRHVLAALAEPEVESQVNALRSAVRGVTPVAEIPVPGLSADTELGRWLVARAGPWVYPTAWDADRLRREYPGVTPEIAAAGRAAASALRRLMRDRAALTSYLAVIVQDLDGLGRFLAGEPPVGILDGPRLKVAPASHRSLSERLGQLGRDQQATLRADDPAGVPMHGVPVYAGGDDLLALAPAATALAAARAVHAITPEDLPRASSAVLFFHRTSSLHRALAEARAMLTRAKQSDRRKHALAVGFLRRSGVSQVSVQPWHPLPERSHTWDGTLAADLFEVFLQPAGAGRGLSPRLVNRLERDGEELARLSRADKNPELFADELTRLVRRHGGSTAEAAALSRLGLRERAAGNDAGQPGRVPVRAARVAVFLRQECTAAMETTHD